MYQCTSHLFYSLVLPVNQFSSVSQCLSSSSISSQLYLCASRSRHPPSVRLLVDVLVRVSVHPPLGRLQRRFVQEPAVLLAASARLHEHDGALHDTDLITATTVAEVAVAAAEGDQEGAGAAGLAASAIHAGAAVSGPVQAQAPAAGVGEAHGLR